MDVFDAVDPTSVSMSAVFDPGQLFVSVDNTNGGIGFGSYDANGNYDPLYPSALFASSPDILSGYDLKSDFVYSAASMSCVGFETLPCDNQPGTVYPLNTDQGVFFMTWQGIVKASFVVEVDSPANVPEPGTLALLPLGMGILGLFRRKQGKPRLS